MRPYFSIGIPVYNEEDRIAKTIESIQTQDIDDYEIVCVDDCSTDSSYQVIKKIASYDERIKLYKNEANRGIAITRQRVCKNASGKIFLWCDSDDRMEPGCLSSLRKLLQDYDDRRIIIIQNAQVNNHGTIKKIYNCRTQELNGKETALRMALGNTWYSYPWTIVGTTELFQNVRYPENAKEYVDDQLASHRYLENADVVLYLDRINYTHYLYEGSDSHNATFYKRLSNTYGYLKDNSSIKDIDYIKAISLMEKMNLAWYYAKLSSSCNNKKHIKAISKKCRDLSYIKCLKWLECKYRIIGILLALAPMLFYNYYNHRKLL